MQWPLGGSLVLQRFLGRGSFGEVYEAIDTSHGNERVAVKRMRDVFSSRRAADARRIYREMHILRHLRHPNICSLLDVICPGLEMPASVCASASLSAAGAGAFSAPCAGSPLASKRARGDGGLSAVATPQCSSSSSSSSSSSTPSSAALVQQLSDLFLVFEFVDTDLLKLLQSPQFLSPAHVKFLLYQLLLGVQCLADAHVVHRDLKPANVLLNENCTLKICDFGMARILKPAAAAPCPGPPSTPAATPTSARSSASAFASPSDTNFSSSSSSGGGGGSSGGLAESRPDARVGAQLRRQLTQHVVTRWYRAPELILLCPDYSSAVDVWSVGCIFAEILGMERASVAHCSQRRPLFPGSSCFPLSGDGCGPGRETGAQRDDQLSVIFSVIGSPSAEEIAELQASPDTRAWLLAQPPLPRCPLSLALPGASPDALDLLARMLAFSPSRRVSVHEALCHPYLAGLRVPAHGWAASSALPIVDADAGPECAMDEEGLLSKVVEEIAAFRAANGHDEHDEDDEDEE